MARSQPRRQASLSSLFGKSKLRARLSGRNRRLNWEQLENRRLLATVTWINTNGGDWDTASNWNANRVPGSGDDVIIPASITHTVTHGSPQSDTVHSITAQSPLSLSAGSLDVTTTLSASSFTLSSTGTLKDAEVTAGSSIVGKGGTLSNVTLDHMGVEGPADASLSMSGGALVDVINGLTDNGTITLSTAGTTLLFDGSQTLGGFGNVDFPGTGSGGGLSASIALYRSGTTLTIGQNLTIHGGYGSIRPLAGATGTSLLNQGTIAGDLAGTGLSISTDFLTSSGTLQATNGGAVSINAGSWTNTGSISETNSTINLGGAFTTAGLGNFSGSGGSINLTGTLTNTGSMLNLNASTGSATLLGGTIIGGTIATSQGAQLVANNVYVSSTLNAVTLAAGSNFSMSAGAPVDVFNGLTDNGTITLSNAYTTLRFDGSQTLDGTGSVYFPGTGAGGGGSASIALNQSLTTKLTLGPNLTVHGGYGSINAGSSLVNQGTSLMNLGTIAGDLPGTGISIATGSLTSSGNLQAIGGGVLSINAGNWTNTGLITETNSTLNLGGYFTTPAIGNYTRTGGTINLTGTLANTGNTLTLNASTGSWSLVGGTIDGGTVATSGGAMLADTTLGDAYLIDDVTLATGSNLSISGGATVVVYGDGKYHPFYFYYNQSYAQLTDNGTITMSGGSTLEFQGGGSTLDGTGLVDFFANGTGGGAIPTIKFDSSFNLFSSLLLGQGITVQGAAGLITSSDGLTGNVINEGTINADGSGVGISLGTPNFYGSLIFTNVGQVEATLGGTLSFNGGVVNTGTITETNSTINLGGQSLTTGGLGTLIRTGGTINLTGTLQNDNNTLTLNASTGSWTLLGGTIIGGTIATSQGAQLVANNVSYSNTLIGVTLAPGSNLSLTNGSTVVVANGLTDNGTISLSGGSRLKFDASFVYSTAIDQTLGGSGFIVFPDTGLRGGAVSSLLLDTSGMTLALGSGLTVHGGYGTIAESSYGLGSTVINQGTIAADSTGVGISINATTFSNQGTLKAQKGDVLTLLSSTSIDQTGTLLGQQGGLISIRGNLTGSTTNANQFAPQATVQFAGTGTAVSPQLLEPMSQDLGATSAGLVGNFAFSSISLANGTRLRLFDNASNSGSGTPESVYTNTLVVPSNTTLDLNGLHLYARAAQLSGTILNGTVTIIAGGGSLAFASPTPSSIAQAGAVDDWSFYARAGQSVTAVVSTGASGSMPPLSTPIGYAQLQLVDSSGTVIATAANTTSGADVVLFSGAIPANGIYHILVQAPSAHSSSTGSYTIGAWDATAHTASLTLNQSVIGHITSPFGSDQWNFVASAGQSVSFALVNSAPGLEFDLTGPGGYSAFTNATASSTLITLPSSGTYTLTVHSTATLSGGVGAYNFRVDQTSQVSLALGTPYNGSFMGDSQAELFAVTVPQSQQLFIQLQNISTADHVEIFAKFGSRPTLADTQFSAAGTSVTQQQVLIPTASPGTWYILVYAEYIANPPTNYTLSAAALPVTLSSVSPDHLGNTADQIITLTGGIFNSSAAVSLVASDGTTYPAGTVHLDLPTELKATFPAGSVPVGTYDVQVSQGGATTTLPNAFRVVQGGFAQLQTHLGVPDALGYHVPATLYLQYSNVGTLAMPAPVIAVTIFQTHAGGNTDANALLTLDSSLVTQGYWGTSIPAGFSNTVQVLASGATPGVLEPGESVTVPIYYAGWQQPWDTSYPVFQPEIGVELPTDTTPIPWSSLQASFQPPNISTPAWNAMFPNLEAQLGNTWGGYVQRLDSDATYLASLGEKVNDLDQLWSYEVQQANGFSPVSVLSSAVDASVLNHGPALSVDRMFLNSINARYQTGPFGRGWEWSDGWQQVLSVVNGIVTITSPDGSQRYFTPDSRGGFFAEPGDQGTLTVVSGGGYTVQEADGSITGFGANGLLAYTQDTNGNRVTAGYTGANLTSLTSSKGQSLAFTYNSVGLITAITDSTGRTTHYTYDPSNTYLLSVTDFAGRTTSYTYETSGAPATENALLTVENPDGTIDNFSYDAQGRLAETFMSDMMMPGMSMMPVTYAYGPAGQVAATDANGGTTTYAYDNNGQLAAVTDALGNATHYHYDAKFELTQVTDPAGQVTSYTYDANGNLVSTTDPNGSTVNYTYTGPFNRLSSYSDPNGNTTNYGYNAQGNLLSITYANNSQQTYSYDPLGNLTETVNRRGQAIKTTTNSMGEVTFETFADGTTTSYNYDVHGNMKTATDATGTTTFTYDPVTEDLDQVTYPGGYYLKFTYDAAGRRTQSVDQTGFTVNYQYDDTSMLAELTDGNGNPIVTYTYDAVGRLSEKDLGNGTYTTYQYDAAGNLLHLVNHAPRPAAGQDGPVNSQFDYTYNNLGLTTSETTLDGQWTYQYDPAGQLTHAIFVSNNTAVVPNQDLLYVYDPAGNRTETIINGVTTQYVTNNLNQYTQIGSSTLTYDADGNLILQSSASGTTSYSYNELNRLIGVTSPTDTTAYQYDPIGNLEASAENGQATRYIVDPAGVGNIVGAYNGTGGVTAHYTYGLGLTSQVSSSGQPYYYDFDAIGSAVGVTGNLGTYANQYRFAPFGGLITSSESIANPFQFVGQLGVVADDNGLISMRARVYSQANGRFLQPDPLGQNGGDYNLTRYVNNDPTGKLDPLGLNTVTTFIANRWDDSCSIGGPSIGCSVGVSLGLGFPPGPPGTFIGCGVSIASASCGFSFPLIPPPGPAKPEPDDPNLEPIPTPLVVPYSPEPKEPPPYSPQPPAEMCGGGPSGEDPAGNTCPPPAPNPNSEDPNAAMGPNGYGPQSFISGRAALTYRIDFENASSASAPAQRVSVTDQLDPSINWSSVQLTQVGFGDNLISIPAGTQRFQTTVPMTYKGRSFVVQIEFGLHTATGQLYAVFQSLDPNTDLPPDVLTGFLPPEDGTGRGMGFFSYTAMLNSGVPTGTQIHNVASITFDTNAPITTDQVDDNDPSKGVDPTKEDVNTIDSVGPTSSVAALPSTEPTFSFTVNWSGQDDPGGSGVFTYDVYVSDNGGPFKLWQPDTMATSATYSGQNGHTYGFYTVGVDNVGNFETTPTQAEATTQVEVQTTPGTVNTTQDSGPGSLRQAILDVNAGLVGSIAFAIPTGDPGYNAATQSFEIQPSSPLPAFTTKVTLDGTTQPGYTGTPLIQVDGTNAGDGANGLEFDSGSDGGTVVGLDVTDFSGDGIALFSNSDTINSCYIGTDIAGTTALPNGTGISIGSSGNTIGGTTAGTGNLISGNLGSGIAISGASATGNSVEGNLIGTDATGTMLLGNQSNGVLIANGASLNIIGGTVAGARNVISDNGYANGTGLFDPYGDLVINSGAFNNTVEGDYIGTDSTGTSSLAPSSGVNFGVHIYGTANNNLIGGSVAGARNVISGNAWGIVINDDGTTANTIAGNYIGTDKNGQGSLGSSYGIHVFSSGNIIGGTTPGAGNLISGNFAAGIQLDSEGFGTCANNLVEGNFIGTNSTGTAPGTGPQNDGIDLGFGPLQATGNTIGGSAPGAGNVISGNTGSGIAIGGDGNLVAGNFIGTDVIGTLAVPNGFFGVHIFGASNNTIGGTDPGDRNVISGNNAGGVGIGDVPGSSVPDTTTNYILGNLIGTDVSGALPLGNVGPGIDVAGDSNTVGSPGAGGNTIAFNSGDGVVVTSRYNGLPVTGNTIRGNLVYHNTGLGIDLGGGGVTQNQTGVAVGSNTFENYPILGSATELAGVLTVGGTLNSLPNQSYTIDFYATSTSNVDPSNHGGASVYLGSMVVSTSSDGNASFSFQYAGTVPLGDAVTATATDSQGVTSEFAYDALVSVAAPMSTYVDPGFASDPLGKVVTWTDGSAHTVGFDAFSSIQSGVNSVVSGGTVNVAPGTYNEQLYTGKSLSLIGAGVSSTTLQASSSLYGNEIGIASGVTVLLSGLNLSGVSSSTAIDVNGGTLTANNLVMSGFNVGVSVENAASALIVASMINGTGTGILVGSGSGDTSIAYARFDSFAGDSVGVQNNESISSVTATTDWWGRPSGPANADNSGGTGAMTLGSVTFSPWLGDSNTITPDYLAFLSTPGQSFVVTPDNNNSRMTVSQGGLAVGSIPGGGTLSFTGTGGTVTIQGEAGASKDVFTINDTQVQFAASDALSGTTINLFGTSLTRYVAAEGTLNFFNIQGAGASGPSGALLSDSGSNVFEFSPTGNLIGSIVGAGYSTLYYAAYSSAVNVNLGNGANGMATGVTGLVSGITTVDGGQYNDTLNAGTVPNVRLNGGPGTNTLSGQGTGDNVMEYIAANYVLSNSQLTGTGGSSFTDNLSGISVISLMGAGNLSHTFNVSGWTGSGTLALGGGTGIVTASKSGGFTLSKASLTSADGMALAIFGIITANLTDTSSGNTFTIAGWTGGGTLKSLGTTETLIDTVSSSAVLANGSLAVTGLPTLNLSGFKTANLTDTAGGNTLTVGAWTGNGSWTNVGASSDTIAASKAAGFTLTNNSLSSTDGMVIGFSGITTANLVAGNAGKTFTVDGWTGTGSLSDTGAGIVSVSKNGGFTLSNTSISSADGMSMSLSGITTANLTDIGTGHFFALTGWTGGGSLNGSAETLVDRVSRSVVLTNVSLAVTGLPTLNLSGFKTANLTDTAGGNTLTVGAWTGNGSWTNVGASSDTIAASKAAGFTLTNNSLSSTDGMVIGFSGITTANLVAGNAGKTFTVDGWTGTGSLSDTGAGIVSVSKNGGFTLSNTSISSADGMSMSLSGITTANLTDIGTGHFFALTGWTGGGSLNGSAETLVDRVSRSVVLTNVSLAVTNLATVNLSGFNTANLTDTAGGNTVTVGAWKGNGSWTNVGASSDTIAASKAAGFTLTNNSLSSTDGMMINFSRITTANLAAGNAGKTFTVDGWTGTGSLSDTGAGIVSVSKNGGFTLSNTSISSADGMSMSLSGITTANLTDIGSSHSFAMAGWTGGGTLKGSAETLVDTVSTKVVLNSTWMAVTGLPQVNLSGFTTANLTDTAGGNTFAVNSWTGSGSWTNVGPNPDTISASKAAGFTLTNNSLSSTDGMMINFSRITTANLAAGNSGKTFKVDGWTGTGSLSDTGAGIVNASKNGGFTLSNTSLTSTDGMSMSLSGITTANLTAAAMSGNPTCIVDASAFTGLTRLAAAGTVNAFLFGGSGNGGTLSAAGSGDCVLIGGPGNQTLSDTGTGYNILIGGTGSDTLTGNGNDILISGKTSYDNDSSANIAALDAILNEWASGDSYSLRISKIMSGVGPGGTDALNSSTVQSDATANTVSDGASANQNNWFILNSKDKVTKKVQETKTIF